MCKISVLYGFRFFNYSTSFSNDDFSSIKEARLLKNDILKLRLIIQIYKNVDRLCRGRVHRDV